MMFQFFFEEEWNGNLPAFLHALKGCEDLYSQALKTFWKVNKDLLHQDARVALENMKENPLMGIQTLVIE